MNFFFKKKISKFAKSKVFDFNHDNSFKYEKTNCELCGSRKFNNIFNDDRYGINQKTGNCLNCGFLFSNPRLEKTSAEKFYHHDYYRDIYEEQNKDNLFKKTTNKLDNFNFKNPDNPPLNGYYENLYFDFINHHAKDYNTVLDIGCGNGLKLLNFKNFGKDVYGVEPSINFSKVHDRYGLNVKTGFIDDVKEKFDLVILSHVFEHLYGLKKIVKKLENITNKYLFIEVPGCITKIPSIQNAHNYYFTQNTLNYFLLNSKFSLIRSIYCKSNNYILALYVKTDNDNSFSYNFKIEKLKLKIILFKYYLSIIKTKLRNFLI